MGGISLLNVTDKWGSNAFDHAATASNAGSMMLLLNAGCLAIDESAVFSGLDPPSAAVAVQGLKARRQVLCALAQQHLLPDQFVVPTDRILDEGAGKLMHSLRLAGITIPHFIISLEGPFVESEVSLCSPGSVYHNEFLTASIADLLWKERFRDIDAIDINATTPLGKHGTSGDFSLADWLISKGAKFQVGCSLSCPLEKSSCPTTISHLIASGLPRLLVRGSFFGFQGFDDRLSREFGIGFESVQCLTLALENPSRDDCRCACSASGCTPLIISLKEDCTEIRHERMMRWKRRILLDSVQERPLEIIRFASFDALELTHTCCKIFVSQCMQFHSRVEDDDIEEVQADEGVLISKFMAVVSELERLYEQVRISLADFFHTYWKHIMPQALSQAEMVDEEELADLRKIGVELVDHVDNKSESQVVVDGDEYWGSLSSTPTPNPRINYWLHFFDKRDYLSVIQVKNVLRLGLPKKATCPSAAFVGM